MPDTEPASFWDVRCSSSTLGEQIAAQVTLHLGEHDSLWATPSRWPQDGEPVWLHCEFKKGLQEYNPESSIVEPDVAKRRLSVEMTHEIRASFQGERRALEGEGVKAIVQRLLGANLVLESLFVDQFLEV